MRSLLFFPLVAAAAGCSWTSDGGLGARFVSPEMLTESAPGSWAGEPIDVYDEHGTVEIVGVPGKTNVTVRAKLVAGARSQRDADAAFADLGAQLAVVNLDGVWSVRCTKASAWHGSVDPESTGCTQLRVEVPAGTSDAPVAITARADYGGVHTSGVTVSKLAASAPFGLVADVVPVRGATIELRGDDSLASGFCSTILRVPPSIASDEVDLSVSNTTVKYVDVDPNDTRYWPGVEVHGLPDLSAPIAPRTASFRGKVGAEGTGAKSIVLHADMGKARLGTDPVPPADELNQCAKYDPIELGASGAASL